MRSSCLLFDGLRRTVESQGGSRLSRVCGDLLANDDVGDDRGYAGYDATILQTSSSTVVIVILTPVIGPAKCCA